MTALINRRHFLAGLASLGAAIALPKAANDAQIDEAWAVLVANPWFFEVSDSRTIVEADEAEPKFNSDVYDIDTTKLKTPRDLLDTVDRHQELGNLFDRLAAEELKLVRQQLHDATLTRTDRKRLQRLEASMLEPDGAWVEWFEIEGVSGLPRFKAEIDKWLTEEADWENSEFWPKGWNSQGQALQFFQLMDVNLLRDLGVVVIEGEHPGSSYYAAELRAPIAVANLAAERLKLPFRFKPEGQE